MKRAYAVAAAGSGPPTAPGTLRSPASRPPGWGDGHARAAPEPAVDPADNHEPGQGQDAYRKEYARLDNVREVMNGIFYILASGCQWRALPKDLPPKSTVYDYLTLWTWDGTLRRLHHALFVQVREQAGKEASPTAAIIDSQGVKSAEKGGRALIRAATTRARRSRARSGTSWSTRWVSP